MTAREPAAAWFCECRNEELAGDLVFRREQSGTVERCSDCGAARPAPAPGLGIAWIERCDRLFDGKREDGTPSELPPDREFAYHQMRSLALSLLSQLGPSETHPGRDNDQEEPCTSAAPTTAARDSEDTRSTRTTALAGGRFAATEDGGTSSLKDTAASSNASGTSSSVSQSQLTARHGDACDL